MKHLKLFFTMLLCCLTTTQLWANDGWVVASEPTSFAANTPFAIKNVTKGNYLSTNGGLVTTFNGLSNDELWVLEPTGEQVEGYDTYFIKSESTGKYWKDDDFNVSNVKFDGYDVHEYAGLNAYFTDDTAEAMKVTVVATDSAGNARAKDGKNGTEGYILTLSYETPNNVCGTPFKLGQQEHDGVYNVAMEPYNEDVAWYFYAVTPTSKKDLALEMYKFESENVGTEPGQYSAASVDAYNAAVQAVKDATDATLDEAIEALKVAYQGIAINPYFQVVTEGAKVIAPTDGSVYTGTVVIPATYNGAPVIALGAESFKGANVIIDMTNATNLKTIEGSVFNNCTVDVLDFRNTQLEVASGAGDNGAGCTVKTVYFPATLTKVDGSFLYNAGNLTDVYMYGKTPAKSVGGYAFSSQPTFHVPESALEAYQACDWRNNGWTNPRNFVNDIILDYTFEDVQNALATYSPYLDNVGTNPGQYTTESAADLQAAVDAANLLTEGATSDQYRAAVLAIRAGFENLELVKGLAYIYNKDCTATVTYPGASAPTDVSGNAYEGDIVIPATVEKEGVTYNVTKIGDNAFRYSKVTSLVIPEGIVEVGERTLNDMSEITELRFPASLVRLSNGDPLCGNKSMKAVYFGNDSLGSALETIPQGCMHSDCQSVANVYFYSVNPPTNRGSYFMSSCPGAKIHVIEKSVDAYKIAWPTIGWGNEPIIVGDIPYIYTYQDLQDAIKEAEEMLANVGTQPGQYKKESATSLETALKFAKKITETAGAAQFRLYCGTLKNGEANLIVNIGLVYNYFDNGTAEVTYIGATAPVNDNLYTGDMVIPDSVEKDGVKYVVTKIGDYALRYSTITSLVIPETVTEIGKSAMNDMSEITEINFPANFKKVGGGDPLCGCENLKVVRFGNLENGSALDEIGQGMCYSGTTLTDVYFYRATPPSKTGAYFLNNCSGAKIHVLESAVDAYKATWPSIGGKIPNIVGDIEVPYTFQDVQDAIATYQPYVDYADDLEGHYTSESADALGGALAEAKAVKEDAGSSAFKAAIKAMKDAKVQLVIVPGLNYILNEEAGTATITYPGLDKPVVAGDNAYTGAITVPATVTKGEKTYKVTTLGERCFIHSAIEAIDFSGATNLTTIEGSVFNNLPIEKLDFRNTKLEVAKGAGDNGDGCAVKVVYFPATLKKIPGSFMWNTSITDVYMYGEIPATEMGIYAFREAYTKIHVPVASLEAYKACAWANNRWGNQARTFVGDLYEAKEVVEGTVDEAKIEELKDKGTKCIDLTGASIDAELDMTEFGDNVVAIVTKESGVTGTNVIVKDGDNYTCDNLVLSDVTSFTADMPIHAAEVSVTKEIKDYEWYSLVLPYESAIAAGMEAFKFVEISGSSMIFEKLEGTIPANTPVLTKMVSEDGESSVSFGGSDCDVAPADMSGLAFKGTYVTIPAGQATGKLILTADGKSFAPASEKASIPAFRCYFEQQDESQSYSVILIDPLTGAKSVLNGEAAEKVFNVLGIASESFGVNIQGDKKFLK